MATTDTESNPGLTAEGLVMIRSEDMPAGTLTVKGYDFNLGVSFDGLMASYRTMGFQATNVALAIDEINKMLRWRLSDDPIGQIEGDEWHDPAVRARTKCTIWLSFTSNMISCGMREIIRYLVQHKLVDVLVTTCGAVEEDVMKCIRPHYMGDFDLKGEALRMRGINRIGNLLVPNLSYVAFEDWFMPVVNRMHDEQEKKKVVWTPSMIIRRFGEEMKDESSVWYWAAKNDIPVFCPGLTDGAVGDMLYFHSWKREGFIVDIAGDVRRINDIAMKCKKSGIVILGGGIIKHHTCNANLMRNGADFAVFINTGQEFDGSDSGAKPDEAVSWGKIKLTATPVKIYADATLVFPLIVAQSFVKYHEEQLRATADATGVTSSVSGRTASSPKGAAAGSRTGSSPSAGSAAGSSA